MRLVSTLFVTALLSTGAQAADYLRGAISAEPYSQPVRSTGVDWSGFYIGAQAIYNNAYVDQSRLSTRAGNSVFPNLGVTDMAGQLISFGKSHEMGSGFGFFVGYNTQWDDVVLGLEVDYNRGPLKARSETGSITRALTAAAAAGVTATPQPWETTVSSVAETQVQDMTAFKVRVGAAYDRFLPFVSGGFVVGRVASRATTLGTTQQYEMQPIVDPVTSQIIGYARINLSNVIPGLGSIKDEGWRWGYTVGAGLEWQVVDNVILRGAWDYSALGTGTVRTTVNAFKGGVAVKF